jgi:dUTP pyrophosphatase
MRMPRGLLRVRLKRLATVLPGVDAEQVKVPVPAYQTEGAAAFDLVAAERTWIPKSEMALIPTGLVVDTPLDHVLLLCPRSSLFSRHGLVLANSVGVIDPDYSGDDDEIKVALYAMQRDAVIEQHERIAQGLFIPIRRAQWLEVETMGGPSRGGFGSTGHV